jgi:hypothetical protein
MSELAPFMAYALGPAFAWVARLFIGFVLLDNLRRIVLSQYRRRGSA